MLGVLGVLGVLREEESDAPTAPQPVLGDLDELIAGWRAAGMTVRFQRTGTVRPLPSPLERTAYRVVQEALTNAGKHAPDSAARVHLRYRPPGLTVDIVTDTPRRGAATDAGGYGLTGLRERLALIGGEFPPAVGPTAPGGSAPHCRRTPRRRPWARSVSHR
ncbi:sensor histidine kinase [Streptomyces johnsoniae]|uniref:histidine kinase n=1 Tax=Streptomyces johnsoniae TaxID=3075532 RepID=A0ABU2S779_9ACTN|nr:hypothetical protein [Streptomyces sp. DSM 41886]MDT0444663.1 hypothetical protein [Streptomyces sp. DSM 41886]